MVNADSDPQPRVGVAIVGAQKCGTTTLAALLAEHPQLCLAAGKEAHLFDQPEVQANGLTAADIDRWWPHRTPGQLLLDATPAYLYLPGCLEALVRHSPAVRVIVVLRPPGARAVSHHGHERRLGVEKRSFLMAMALERRRLRRSPDPLAADSAQRHASYRDRGRYAAQLARLASLTEHSHVVLLHDLVAEPQRVMDEIHRFLGVAPRPVGEVPRSNPGDGRRRRVATAVAGWWMRRESAAAERALRAPVGSLR